MTTILYTSHAETHVKDGKQILIGAIFYFIFSKTLIARKGKGS